MSKFLWCWWAACLFGFVVSVFQNITSFDTGWYLVGNFQGMAVGLTVAILIWESFRDVIHRRSCGVSSGSSDSYSN